jgi:hypothetical protein
VNEPPPADLLRRLRPIPTYRDHPATSPHDVAGQSPEGEAITLELVGSERATLLIFLSTTCLGCQDLWEGTDEIRAGLPKDVDLVLVTRGAEAEDAAAVAGLAPMGVTTVMSSPAFAEYRVGGPPFLVVVAGSKVATEGVAWGIEETVRATRAALEA